MCILLHLDCSPQRHSRSVSRQITAHGTRAWQQHNPQGVVLYRDLTKTPLLPLGQSWVDGKDLPAAERSEEEGFALMQSEHLAGELLQADTLLIGTPMHNFNLPAVLKLWFDHVMLPGKTIRFTASGAEGLLKVRRAVVVIASGGSYKAGEPAHALDFETPYVDFLLRSLGIAEVMFVHAFDTQQAGRNGEPIETFLQPFQAEVARLLVEPEQRSLSMMTNEEEEDACLVTASK